MYDASEVNIDAVQDPLDPASRVQLTPKAREWLELVVAWRLSGDSIRAWCAARGLKYSTLGWWRRRLEDLGVDVDAQVDYARWLADQQPAPADDDRAPGLAGRTRPIPVVDQATSGPPLSSPSLLMNRELTWMSFNERVLHEAIDPRTPLLERVRFLSIVGSNLDEFFMKRIGGLKQQQAAGVRELTVDGRSPHDQIALCQDVYRATRSRMEELLAELTDLLAAEGIRLASWNDLDDDERQQARDAYRRDVFPLVTPQSVDPAHPFPFVSNVSLNMLVVLKADGRPLLGRVKVPTGGAVDRLQRVGDVFVPLEDVVRNNLDLLFPGMEVESCHLFRVTRNAYTEQDEETADDLLAMIESELRERKFAPIVRLELERSTPALLRGRLAAELGLDELEDVFEVGGLLAMRDLSSLCRADRPDLLHPPHHPLDHPTLKQKRSIFHILRDAGSVLLHHPYESFGASVERFLREAAHDPKVLAIKATLYRTAEDSAVVENLIDAARNGKQVAVVVELKARFDEAANIRWANALESVGIHVTYGVVGLKTHCKAVLVVRRDYDGLRRYAHLSTGNYHSVTARLYTDFGLLTSDNRIGEDLTELFNYLTTGYTPRRKYQALLVAPVWMKSGLLKRVDREIHRHLEHGDGHIRIKTNALEDADITRALYRASQAGVKIDLVVRDTCRLRPGLPGISETVTVVSVVGRFLEHARVVYFHNGGDSEYFVGSADCMKRNLESRVEVLLPLYDKNHQAQVARMFELQLHDQRSAWELQSDGSYIQRWPGGDGHAPGAQQASIDEAVLRQQTTAVARRSPLARKKKKKKGGRRR